MRRAERIFQVIILLSFIWYSQFYKLDALAYQIWDEARLATNAYEMSKTGNLLIPTADYLPEMWSTKPPMMIWTQAACIKVNGLSEFSVRFPSALSAALTILLVSGFVFYFTKSGWTSLLAGIILSTSQGYIGYHGTRFGEYDSMLTLFTTSYLLAFFLYVESYGKWKSKFLFLFFMGLIFACLTKGIAGLLFTPALLLYLFMRKQFVSTLKNRFFYLGVVGFVSVVGGYYLLRETYNPGYLEAVLENELGGRFLKLNEGHYGPADFYFTHLKGAGFGNWFWALPVSISLLFFNNRGRQFRVSCYCLLCALLFLCIISSSQTKLSWYDLPAYPLFAISISITFLQLARFTNSLFPTLTKDLAVILLSIIFSIQPVYEMFQMIRYSGENSSVDFYNVSYYMRDAISRRRDFKNYILLSSDYDVQWKLYAHTLDERGVKIFTEHFHGDNIFKAKDRIITHQPNVQAYLEQKYIFTIAEQKENVRLYDIITAKP